MSSARPRPVRSLVVLIAGLAAASATAQTGVSDDRVSLPDGPGSLDGLGDNASVSSNTGAMSYSVSFTVPAGFPAVTPSLGLSYASSAGQSVVGMGWSMAAPSIERMTSHGLPAYGEGDRFVADGSAELVLVSGPTSEPRVYRARFEGGFVRYSWFGRGAGDEGHWTAEYPDGSVSYYGADATGASVESARVRAPDGVFRYLLTETRDVFDHALRYEYRTIAGSSVPQLDFIGWVYDGADARYSVSFDYEARADAVSDCRGGFNELLGHRLTGVRVYSGLEEVRRYALVYEDYADAGGMSRLAGVEQLGHEGGRYPVAPTFGYSQSLGGLCDGVACTAPYLVDMGSLGSNVLQTGEGTLIDMNGDALPDLIVTPSNGDPHRIYLAELASDGTQSFLAPYSSAVAASSDFRLTSNTVQELDYDGNGFADLVDHVNQRVLVNTGSGDWSAPVDLAASGLGGAVDASDFDDATAVSAGEGELKNIKFFDYDADGRIDILKTIAGATVILRGVGAGGYELAANVEDLGATFEDDNLELADMNGDGLLDPVRVQAAGVSYRLHLGRGQWTGAPADPWTVMGNTPVVGDAELEFTSLEDLNGDGIDDIIVVLADRIRYAINRNGATFDDVQTITTVGASALPQRDGTTTVLFADMNANGSNDVVWVDGAGNLTFLELFPERPNLLTRVENGIGMVTEVRYETSVEQRAAVDGVGWENPLPSPMVVAAELDVYAELGDPGLEVRSTTRWTYADGFYDGVEKQFQGFATVRQELRAGAGQADGTILEEFDVGATDPYRAGKLLRQQVIGAAGPFSVVESTWDDCDVDGVPTSGLALDVRFVCQTGLARTLQEGAPEAEWIEQDSSYEYDGYGNVTLFVDHGVTAIGGAGCAACTLGDDAFSEPCGAQCLGDEAYVETTYVPPDKTSGAWILSAPSVSQTYGRPGAERTETAIYYDGQPFVGLDPSAAVALTKGLPSRITERVSNAVTVDAKRARFDDDGNAVEVLSPNGALTGALHRTYLVFDSTGLELLTQESPVTGADGDVHTLREDFAYDPLFGGVIRSTGQYIKEDGVPDDSTTTRTGYDEFGRVSWLVQPGGDTPSSPTLTFTYEMDAPLSATTVERRTTVGGELDQRTVSCSDGLGRTVQERELGPDDEYLVSGFATFNRRGQMARQYRPWTSTSAACEAAPPAGTPFLELGYDEGYRSVSATEPDDGVFGSASLRTTAYAPLAQWSYDPEDNDPDSAHFDTPTVIYSDGLGRLVRIDQLDAAGDALRSERFTYDSLGRLRSWVDSEGNEKTQRYDALGRLVEVDDPDRGLFTFAYDDAGNLVRREDARGVVIRMEYDELDRRIATWDEAAPADSRMEWVWDRDDACGECDNGAGLIVTSRYPLDDLGTGTDSFGYDLRGQPVFIARELLGQRFVFETERDNAGRAISETYPDGRVVLTSFDALDRVSAVTGLIPEVKWGLGSQLESVQLENGVTTRYAYDDGLRITGLRAETAAGDALLDLTFERDRVDNFTRVEDARGDAPASLGATYAYDALYRLTEASLEGGPGAETLTHRYDALDRVLEKVSTRADSPADVGDFSYGGAAGPRAVADAGAMAFAYDEAGRATSRGDQRYTWDAYGRLASATTPEGDARYGYTAGNQRIVERHGDSVTLRLAPSFYIRDGVSRVWAGIDSRPLVELQSTALASSLLSDVAPGTRAGDDFSPAPDGDITSGDAWVAQQVDGGALLLAGGGPVSAVDALLRSSARAMLIESEEAPTAYFHADLAGSVVAVTDTNAAVTERISYTPFGQVRDTTAVHTEYAAYTGKRYDETTGLIHIGARDYDPRSSRWLSPDPLWDAMDVSVGSNLTDAVGAYSYAGNNPTTYTDEDGQFVHMLVGAILGATAAMAVDAASMYFENKNQPAEKKLSKKQVAGRLALAFVIGGSFGAISGGTSAIGAVIAGAGDIAVEREKSQIRDPSHARTELSRAVRVGQIAGHVTGGVLSAGAGWIPGADPQAAASLGVSSKPAAGDKAAQQSATRLKMLGSASTVIIAQAFAIHRGVTNSYDDLKRSAGELAAKAKRALKTVRSAVARRGAAAAAGAVDRARGSLGAKRAARAKAFLGAATKKRKRLR